MTQADHDRQSKVEQASGVVAGEDDLAATRPSSFTADALVVKLQTIESTRGRAPARENIYVGEEVRLDASVEASRDGHFVETL